MVIAILIFLTYHFISIFAKNSSEDNSLNPVVATWLAGIIMLPFSIYLTSRATKDRALMDLDAILIPLKKKLVKSRLSQFETAIETKVTPFKDLTGFDNSKLIELVKNYRHYGLSTEHKNKALMELKARGIDEMTLKISGHLTNEDYESGIRFLDDYHENATVGVLSHTTFLIFGILGLVLNNNKFPTMGLIFIAVAALGFIVFLIVLPKVFKNQSEFYELLKKRFVTNNVVFVILAFPLFFLYRLYFNKKMKEDLNKIS
jgi:lipopolysaccharide export system permease protein